MQSDMGWYDADAVAGAFLHHIYGTYFHRVALSTTYCDELPIDVIVTPATRPLVSIMQRVVPWVRGALSSNTVPVVHAEYVGVEPFGRLTIFSLVPG